MTSQEPFHIEEDIRRAETPPAAFYREPRFLDLARERVFARSWQLVPEAERLREPGQLVPFSLLEGCLDEPLLLTRDAQGEVRCLSNVCTHRGNVVVKDDCRGQGMRCGYHGRRFGLDGRFQSMPEFEGAEGFPSPRDDLPRVALGRLGSFTFASVAPASPLESLVAPVRERLAWFPFEKLALDRSRSRDYLVQASWALYLDNYLEGFHIPYVHPALSGALSYPSYRTETFEQGSVQIGVAALGEDTFELPPSSADAGQRIAAYYFWLFPNTMLNVYPWGISVNVVVPLAVDRTRVSFLSYVSDPSKLDRGAGSGLDRVEKEDEAVVESVQRGVRSRLYERGRYSPSREIGVHHFHRLLARALST
ncbi:aromatic ring-hydroxylating dioxygenase subunit alpha [bacterium]|nr:aromatic ring-hydroxylating dioxygenase subunit alpha [bacterium]